MKPVANAALESGDLHVYWYIRRTINPTFTYQLKELAKYTSLKVQIKKKHAVR